MSVTRPGLESLRATVDSEPFEFYDRLRESGRLVWDEGMNAWLNASYAGCKYVSRNEEVLFRHAYLDLGGDTYVELEGGPRNILFLHADDHAGLHRWFMKVMSPNRVEEWRPSLIRPVFDELVDRFASRGRVELFHEFADKLPVRVIAAIVGLDWRDDELIDFCKEQMDDISLFLEAHGLDDPEVVERALAASHRMNELLMPIIRERKGSDGGDVISQMWSAGRELLEDWDEIDMRANVRILFFGGADTTTHTIANSLHALMTKPDLAETVRRGDERTLHNFCEEMLRLYGAIHFRPRVANVDVEVQGCPVAKDEGIVNVNLAANRDPERYPDPHEVNLQRPAPRDHFAFHYGPRMCVGAALARAEIQEVVRGVLERLPDLRLDPDAPEPPLFKGFLMRSYRPLHAVFTPPSG
jgi:cytochrome P450